MTATRELLEEGEPSPERPFPFEFDEGRRGIRARRLWGLFETPEEDEVKAALEEAEPDLEWDGDEDEPEDLREGPPSSRQGDEDEEREEDRSMGMTDEILEVLGNRASATAAELLEAIGADKERLGTLRATLSRLVRQGDLTRTTGEKGSEYSSARGAPPSPSRASPPAPKPKAPRAPRSQAAQPPPPAAAGDDDEVLALLRGRLAKARSNIARLERTIEIYEAMG